MSCKFEFIFINISKCHKLLFFEIFSFLTNFSTRIFLFIIFDFGVLKLDSCVKLATVLKDNKPRKLPLYRAVGLSRRTLQNNSKNLKILKLQNFRKYYIKKCRLELNFTQEETIKTIAVTFVWRAI